MERKQHLSSHTEPEQGEGTEGHIPFDPTVPDSVEAAATQLQKRFSLPYTPTLCYSDKDFRRYQTVTQRLWNFIVGG